MHSLVAPGPNTHASLKDYGYTRVGLDDCWQACGTGVNGSFHNAAGTPLINKTLFPDLGAMTVTAKSLGLQPGFYMKYVSYCLAHTHTFIIDVALMACFAYSNCQCSEHEFTTKAAIDRVFNGSVQAFRGYDFEGLKLDSCSEFDDIHRWSRLVNSSGPAVLIENCHNGPAPTVLDNATGELDCPFNIYRTGSDITPGSWLSFLNNLAQLVPFLAHEPPLSRPGCFAYPDAVQSGSFQTFEEDRANFGAWVVTSSPLILGFNVSNEGTRNRAWPILTNTEAIRINHQYAGHPGKLLRIWSQNVTLRRIQAVPCNGSSSAQHRWLLIPSPAESPESLLPASPLSSIQNSAFPGLCVDSSEPGGQGNSGLQLRPCVTSGAMCDVRINGVSRETPLGKLCMRVSMMTSLNLLPNKRVTRSTSRVSAVCMGR